MQGYWAWTSSIQTYLGKGYLSTGLPESKTLSQAYLALSHLAVGIWGRATWAWGHQGMGYLDKGHLSADPPEPRLPGHGFPGCQDYLGLSHLGANHLSPGGSGACAHLEQSQLCPPLRCRLRPPLPSRSQGSRRRHRPSRGCWAARPSLPH